MDSVWRGGQSRLGASGKLLDLSRGQVEEAVMARECELQNAKCWEVGLAQSDRGDRAVGAAAA